MGGRGGEERQCLSAAFLFLCSQHCYGDFKQDGGAIPTHHSRCSSPLHRPQEQPLPPQAAAGEVGGDRVGRCIAPLRGEPPPKALQGQLLPHPRHGFPSPPSSARYRRIPRPRAPTGPGRGMQRWPSTADKRLPGRGAQPLPPPAARSGAPQPAPAPSIPSPHPRCSWSIPPLGMRSGSWGGGAAGG